VNSNSGKNKNCLKEVVMDQGIRINVRILPMPHDGRIGQLSDIHRASAR